MVSAGASEAMHINMRTLRTNTAADSSNPWRQHKLPWLFTLFLLLGVACHAQAPEQIYGQLSKVALDPASAISVRGAALDHEDLHFSFNEGTLIFTQPVAGRITGALFVGDGELLVIPPAQEERQSMALFTGTAVLNEKFGIAYFRFDSQAIAEKLRRQGRTAAPEDISAQYAPFVATLAPLDALPLAINMTSERPRGSYLHARVVGRKLGTFDVVADSTQPEQVVIGQFTPRNDIVYLDTWASFCFRSKRDSMGACVSQTEETVPLSYRINATVTPPHSIEAEAAVRFKVADNDGRRIIAFQLGRGLTLLSVTLGGKPLPFIVPVVGNNERPSDTVAIILPQPARAQQQYEVTFKYSGPILSDAGGGLVYIRERGNWYPWQGMNMADFDLTFHYPAGWQLLASGSAVDSRSDASGQHSHWKTDRPIPFAGFNLGHFEEVKLPPHPELPAISAYAAKKVESALESARQSLLVVPPPATGWHRRPRDQFELAPQPPSPNPSRNALAVAQQAEHSIQFLQPKLGKFPFKSLQLTQLPGYDSQGFPSLIYLSSLVFLTPEQRWRGRTPPDDFAPEVLYSRVMAAHETAHQWWGDKITWNSYREQWLCEAIANYLALMQLEQDSPDDFATMLENYRNDLLTPLPDSKVPMKEAGAVTLGQRLSSSKFPNGYDAIAYGRGTWLIHMLRQMYRDAAAHPVSAIRGKTRARSTTAKPAYDPDAAFFGVLRALQEKFDGKPMTTADMKQAFEAALPAQIRFQDQPSLDWFFESWVSSTAIPQLELRSVKIKAATASFNIRQTQCAESTVTSVPIYVEMKDGSSRFLARVFAEGLETEFKLRVPAGTAKLLLDPYRSVLRM